MFENLQRELRKLGRGLKVPVEIPLDEKGYLDRECPTDDCKAAFKVMYEPSVPLTLDE